MTPTEEPAPPIAAAVADASANGRGIPYTFFALSLAVLVVFILWVARGVIVPLVAAMLVSFLIMALKRGIDRLPLIGRLLPQPMRFVLAFAAIAVAIVGFAIVVRENFEGVLRKAPAYQERLQTLAGDLVTWAETQPLIPSELVAGAAALVEGFGSGLMPDADDDPAAAAAAEGQSGTEQATPEQAAPTPPASGVVADIQRQAFGLARGAVGALTGAAGSILGAIVTIFLYTAFLLVERGRFTRKLIRMAQTPDQARHINEVLEDVGDLVRKYLSMKTLINLAVATVSFLIMTVIGTDFAGFWALLIFAFGYVPIVGAIFAISLPTMLALVEPDGGLGKAALTLALLTIAEQSISTVVEPRVMGKSLNLSPLVILVSLASWATLWGFAGMLLCVPMTVVLLIVLSQFEVTRPLAILLSANGEIAPARPARR